MCSKTCSSLDALTIDESVASNECVSCKKESEFVIRKVNGYCTSCFMECCKQKFRSTIGKTKKMKPSDRVLVILDSKLGSVAAKSMLLETKNDPTRKKLTFDFEFASLNDESVKATDEVRSILKCYGNVQRNATLKLSADDFTQLNHIVDYALKEGFHKIFVCDSGCEIAVKMLTAVTLGRGSQMADLTGAYSQISGIGILRPLREFTDEELEKYLELQKIRLPPGVKIPNSIQSITESFVGELQKDFPSTVPTIWRTADKISVKDDGSVKCDFCRCAFVSKSSEGAMEALDVSAKLSTILSISESRPELCHSCRQFSINRTDSS